MRDFQLILDEENTIVVDTLISGDSVSTKGMKTRLIVETEDGFDLIFEGSYDSEQKNVTFRTPILANTLPSGEYKTRMEFVLADSRLFTPMEGTLEAVMPTKVNASIRNASQYKEADLSPVEIKVTKEQTEERAEEEDSGAAELKEAFEEIESNIEEFKLAEGKEFETKELGLELKMLAEAETEEYGTFTGYGAVFGNIDSHKDVITKGAFARTLNSGRKIAFLWQHDQKSPIGVFDSIEEDEFGLKVRGRFALGTTKGREAYELVKMGALDGLSIGYVATKKSLDKKSGVRTLSELKVFEISAVTIGSNELATMRAVKSGNQSEEKKDAELAELYAELKSLMPA